MNLIDDPKFVRLIFGVHREPGAYALLLGSGVSRGAGTPSGWDITVKLVEDLAKTRAPGTVDALQWYAAEYGEEPRYDRVLELLGKGSADRQAMVREFFEPTQEEREKGIKTPGIAHKSIARLVKRGYIHVILTTNFDRLLESALNDAGVTPNVVYGAEGIEGARSYAAEPCTIVKMNGDYQDTRIRNSTAELSTYPANLTSYLSAILDAFGLVICGWSATYDTALARLLKSHPNLRYGTYRLAKEDLSSEALHITDWRKADIISADSADTAFQELADRILLQESGTRTEPFSVDQITAIIRECAGDPAREPRLADTMREESQRVVELMSQSVTNSVELTKETVQATIDKTASAAQPITSAAAYLSYFGSAAQARWTLNAFGRLAQTGLALLEKDPGHGLVLLPAVLVTFSSLLGALLADKADTAAKILLSPIVRYDGSPIHWPTRVNELTVFGAVINARLLPQGKVGQLGAGTIIRDALENMPHVAELATSGEGFTAAYETAEYAVGLVAQAHIEKEMGSWYVPAGTILWRWSWLGGGGSQRYVEPLEIDVRNSGLKNALLSNGFAEGDSSTYDTIEKQYRESLAKYGRNP